MAINFEKKIDVFPSFALLILKRIFSVLPGKFPVFRRMKKISRNWGDSKKERLLVYFNWLPDDKLVNDLVKGLPDNFDVYKYAKSILQEFDENFSIKSNAGT